MVRHTLRLNLNDSHRIGIANSQQRIQFGLWALLIWDTMPSCEDDLRQWPRDVVSFQSSSKTLTLSDLLLPTRCIMRYATIMR